MTTKEIKITATIIPAVGQSAVSINQRMIPIMLFNVSDKKTKERIDKKEKEKSPLKKQKYVTQVSELSCNSYIIKHTTPYRRGGEFRSQFSCKNYDMKSIHDTLLLSIPHLST